MTPIHNTRELRCLISVFCMALSFAFYLPFIIKNIFTFLKHELTSFDNL